MQKFFKRAFVSVKVFLMFLFSLRLMIDENAMDVDGDSLDENAMDVDGDSLDENAMDVDGDSLEGLLKI